MNSQNATKQLAGRSTQLGVAIRRRLGILARGLVATGGVAILTLSVSGATVDEATQALLTSSASAFLAGASLQGSNEQIEVLSSEIAGFGTDGETFVVLSSGKAAEVIGDPEDFASTSFDWTPNEGISPDGYPVYDAVALEVDLLLPGNAETLGFGFAFGTEENPTYLGSPFQDFFQALLLSSTGELLADTALLPDGTPVTVDNAAAFSNAVNGHSHAPTPPFSPNTECSMNAMTEQFPVSVDVKEHAGDLVTLVFLLADAADSVLDSAVFLDGLFLTTADAPRSGSPRVRILGTSAPAGGGGAAEGSQTVILTVCNTGDSTYRGGCEIEVGLSYDPTWLPEWCTRFATTDIGSITLEPRECRQIALKIPEIPQECLDAFTHQIDREWVDYEDKDPDQDYFGIEIKLDGGSLFTFVPFET